MKRTCKKSLIFSIISLLLCISMLTGTTFAWFTDTVISGNNIIIAGNIDIRLEYWNGSEWKDVKASSEIINNNVYWEPGHTEVVYLKLKNAGSLGLRYKLGVNIIEETEGVNQRGESFRMSEYIYFDVARGVNGETDAYANRDSAMEIATEQNLISEGYSQSSTLASGTEVYLAMVIYMPTWVGDDINHNGFSIPEIKLGINAFATQLNADEEVSCEIISSEAETTTVIEDTTVAEKETTSAKAETTLPEEATDADEDVEATEAPDAPVAVGIEYLGETVFFEGDKPTLKALVTYDDGSTEEIAVTDDMFVIDDTLFKPDFAVSASYRAKISYGGVTTDTMQFMVIDPRSDLLISNSEFVYGSYYDLEKDATEKLTHNAYGLGKTSDVLLTNQSVLIKIDDTDLSKYNVTLSYFDAEGHYKSRAGITKIENGQIIIPASAISGTYFRISIYIYSPFTKIPETASINVYKIPASAEKVSENVLISNSEFVYGAYYDLNKGDGHSMMTSGDYVKGKTSHTLLENQDVLVKVVDNDLSKYNVTISYFDSEGNYIGRSGIIKMVDGVLEISASSIPSTHFRVSVYIYSPFAKIPETAVINVYRLKELTPWEGDTISIIGDSISVGGYPSVLGNMLGAQVDNNAVSGTTVTGNSGLVAQLSGIDENSDLIVVFGGTNDYWRKSISIGTLADEGTGTYLGALKHIITYLRSNHPDAEYIFVFPYEQHFSGSPSTTDFGKGTLNDFRLAFLSFCEEYDVEYVDLTTTDFDHTVHTGDGVHANTAGHQIIAEAIYEKISEGN